MKYLGMNSSNGKKIAEVEHIRQSVSDILKTPIGSRIARRHYGSLLFELMDSPQNDRLRLQLMAACYAAVQRWEPRIRLTELTVSSSEAGALHVNLSGFYADADQPFSFSIKS